jgi:ATP phosphoribosyltransferase regulatory subunit
MKQYAKVTPEGSRDLLFEECDDRRRVENALTGLYEANGYRKVITPTLEFFDVFNSGDAGLDADEMYKLTDNRGRTTVLRPDNTLPIARLVATRLSEKADLLLQ